MAGDDAMPASIQLLSNGNYCAQFWVWFPVLPLRGQIRTARNLKCFILRSFDGDLREGRVNSECLATSESLLSLLFKIKIKNGGGWNCSAESQTALRLFLLLGTHQTIFSCLLVLLFFYSRYPKTSRIIALCSEKEGNIFEFPLFFFLFIFVVVPGIPLGENGCQRKDIYFF